jgi:hypothetical protein
LPGSVQTLFNQPNFSEFRFQILSRQLPISASSSHEFQWHQPCLLLSLTDPYLAFPLSMNTRQLLHPPILHTMKYRAQDPVHSLVPLLPSTAQTLAILSIIPECSWVCAFLHCVLWKISYFLESQDTFFKYILNTTNHVKLCQIIDLLTPLWRCSVIPFITRFCSVPMTRTIKIMLNVP